MKEQDVHSIVDQREGQGLLRLTLGSQLSLRSPEFLRTRLHQDGVVLTSLELAVSLRITGTEGIGKCC